MRKMSKNIFHLGLFTLKNFEFAVIFVNFRIYFLLSSAFAISALTYFKQKKSAGRNNYHKKRMGNYENWVHTFLIRGFFIFFAIFVQIFVTKTPFLSFAFFLFYCFAKKNWISGKWQKLLKMRKFKKYFLTIKKLRICGNFH